MNDTRSPFVHRQTGGPDLHNGALLWTAVWADKRKYLPAHPHSSSLLLKKTKCSDFKTGASYVSTVCTSKCTMRIFISHSLNVRSRTHKVRQNGVYTHQKPVTASCWQLQGELNMVANYRYRQIQVLMHTANYFLANFYYLNFCWCWCLVL